MALETPNLVRASCLLLIENFFDDETATVKFATNNGFSSVRFIDPDEVPVGIVLALDQPLSNMEGSVYLGGDPLAEVSDIAGAYITPLHVATEEPLIDDLDPNQVVVLEMEGDDVFRLNILVIGQGALLEAPAGEPIFPP